MNLKHIDKLMGQLGQGIFLTVRNGDKVNTMTVGWSTVGIMWYKPVLMVPVRFSRYTYEMLQNADEFTISVPLDNSMKEALAFSGTKSGRDIDKFKALGLTKKTAKNIETPIIGECHLHYECKIVHRQAIEPGLLDPAIQSKAYPNHNYHVMFYGEILSEYIL